MQKHCKAACPLAAPALGGFQSLTEPGSHPGTSLLPPDDAGGSLLVPVLDPEQPEGPVQTEPSPVDRVDWCRLCTGEEGGYQLEGGPGGKNQRGC